MATDVTVPQTFQDRLKERIKDSISDLLTDAELKVLCDRTLEELFFKPRVVKTGSSSWNSEVKELPPLLHDIVKSLIEPRMKAAVEAYLKSNPEVVAQAVEKVILEGAGNALIKALNMQFQSSLLTLQTSLQTQLYNKN